MNDIVTEASRYILGSLIQYGHDAFVECADIINEDSFIDDLHQILWKIFYTGFSRNNPPSKISGAEYLAIAKELGFADEVKDNKKLFNELKSKHIDLTSVRTNAALLRKQQTINDLLFINAQTREKLLDISLNNSFDDIINAAQNPILDYLSKLSSSTINDVKLLSDGAHEYINELLSNPRQYVGIPSFCEPWNLAVGGGYRPGLQLLSARRKIGKSNHAINDAKFIAELGIPILYLDREMMIEIAQTRMTSSLSKVKVYDIEHGNVNPASPDHNKILRALEKLSNLPIYYKNVAMCNDDEIVSIIKRWCLRYVGFADNGKMNPCLVILDYIKINSSGELGKDIREYQAIGFTATKLAAIGITYGIPISAYVQSNKEDEVSMSDRLSWLCNSLTYLRKPDDNELISVNNLYNRKIEIDCCRFVGGLNTKDFIALKMDGASSNLEVIGLKSQLNINHQGNDNNDDDTF